MSARVAARRLLVPRLFVLLDTTDDFAVVSALARAGVDGFQVRDKSLGDADLLAFTRRVIDAVPGVAVVVNDRLDIALAAGAAGVHLGADDLPVAEARRLAPDLLIGGTCRTRESAVLAREAGADYVGFGPVFRTFSKAGLPEPLGVEAIAEVADVLPIIAIGGIDAAGAAAVRAAGAYGVAAIGAVWHQSDPVAAARELAGAVA